MEPNENSDTVSNRLAQLEKLVRAQKDEIRRISLERDLFAAWYKATEPKASRPGNILMEES